MLTLVLIVAVTVTLFFVISESVDEIDFEIDFTQDDIEEIENKLFKD